MQLRVTKVHGSGNDFFLLDESQLEKKLTKKEMQHLGQVFCQDETGLLGGADGLIVISEPSTDETKACLHILTKDGQIDNMSGNGLRVAARLIAEREDKNEFLIETMHKDLKVRRFSKSEKGDYELPILQVEIAPVSFQASAIPLNLAADETIINQKISSLSSDLRFTAIAAPHPHLIAFVDHDTLDSSQLLDVATEVNDNHELFPEGISVSFVEILAKDTLYVRTYKKETGFTSSCGTAVAASSLLYSLFQRREFGKKILVETEGGLARTIVHQDRDGSYWMELIGDAVFSHEITISLEDALANDFSKAQVIETGEKTE